MNLDLKDGDPVYLRATFVKHDTGDVRIKVRTAGGNEYVLTVPGEDALVFMSLGEKEYD